MLTEQAPSPVNDEDVSVALHAILTTDKFSASPQMSAFLKYVVEQTLLGNTRRIKAFTVGIEALGKSASFDPQTDPSVRVLAKRLRSSLNAYYEQNPDTTVFIEMKPGSYVPKFLLRSEMAPATTITQDVAMGYQPGAASPSSVPTTATAAHLSVQPQPVTNERAEETADREESNKAAIAQLWEAYKSASKVA